MKTFKTLLAITSIATALLVSACGTSTGNNNIGGNQASGNSNYSAIGTNPPFTVRLNQEVVTPSPNFDPISTQITQAQVLSWTGTQETLNFTKPVLFVAYWCPHCQRTLILLQKNWQTLHQHPAIVFSGYQPGSTLAQAKTLFSQEESALHFHFPTSEVYFLLNSSENKQLVQAYPELYFTSNQKPETLIGEHVLSVWQKILS